MLDESQWWPEERLVAWQRQHLRALLNHARSSVPYYRFRLNKVFRPNGEIDWDRWHEIPIVTRADVLANYKTMLSNAPIPGHGPFQDVQSTGSTGHPVTVRTTTWLMQMGAACNWRAHRWAGLDWSKTLVTTVDMHPQWSVGQNIGPWGPSWLPESQKGQTLYTHYHVEFDERLALMKQTGASYFATTSSTAENIGRRARRDGWDVRLEAVLSRGGAVTDQLREEVRAIFGAEIVEFYSSKESGAIAQRCSSGHGYHVNAEALLFEVVDGDGRPVAPGQRGRAVVTPFGSTAMPLVRYDQGDVVVAGARCACGRTLPHFEEISGRERVEFRHPDGRRRDLNLTRDCYEKLGAGQLQAAQVGPTLFEVRYVPHDWGVPRDETAFIAQFRELSFSDAEVRLVAVDEIPLSKAGKFLSSVLEWTPDA